MNTHSNNAPKRGNMHGKHHPDKVLLGLHVSPEEKALAQITAGRLNMTVSELMMDGLRYNATMAGVMINGRIADEFKDEIVLQAALIRENKKERQSR